MIDNEENEENKPDKNERQAGCSDANCYADDLYLVCGMGTEGEYIYCRCNNVSYNRRDEK